MSTIVSKSKSEFIEGRLIRDNILMAQEIIRGYNRKGISPRLALKVEIHKAYYSLCFHYLEKALKGVGLPNKFLNWVMKWSQLPLLTPLY